MSACPSEARTALVSGCTGAKLVAAISTVPRRPLLWTRVARCRDCRSFCAIAPEGGDPLEEADDFTFSGTTPGDLR